MIGKGIQLNGSGVETHLMMETSGHGAIKENYYLDDGAYLAVKAIIEFVRLRSSGKGDISSLLQDLEEPLEAREFRVKIQDPDFKVIGSKALSAFHDWVNPGKAATAGATAPSAWKLTEVNNEGWRVDVDEGSGKAGWVLLRQSLHDPILVLNVESEVEGGLKEHTAHVLRFFKEHCQGLALDFSALAH